MSEVNLQFTVNSYSTTIEVGSTELSFNPTGTNLSIYTGYTTFAPGGPNNNTQVLFNDVGSLNSSSSMVFDKILGKTTIANLTVTNKTVLGNILNVTMTGGSNGQFITTNGNGNLSFSTLQAGGNTSEIQFNNANSFAGDQRLTYNSNTHVLQLSGDFYVTGKITATDDITFSGSNVNLGSNTAVHITGGNVGDIISTDSYGTLSWIPQAGGSGNGVAGGPSFSVQFNSGNANFGGTQSLTYSPTTGTINIQQVAEKVQLSNVGSVSVVNFDLISQSIIHSYNNATGNFTLNFRGSTSTTLNDTMDIGRSMTCVYINKNGSPAYYANAFQVDGVSVTPKWFDSTAPGAGSVNAFDVYTFNILKTANASFTIFAVASRFA